MMMVSRMQKQRTFGGPVYFCLAKISVPVLMACMVYIILAPATAAAPYQDCAAGQYYVTEIRRCLNCNQVCHTPKDKRPIKCESTCKASDLDAESECSKGYHYEDAIGRCVACNITCPGKPKEKCPGVCKGWDTMSTTMANPMQQDEGQPDKPRGGNRKLDPAEVDINAGVKDLAQTTKPSKSAGTSMSTDAKVGLGFGIGIGMLISISVGVVLYRRKMRLQQENNDGNADEQQGLDEGHQRPIQEEGQQAGILMQEAVQ